MAYIQWRTSMHVSCLADGMPVNLTYPVICIPVQMACTPIHSCNTDPSYKQCSLYDCADSPRWMHPLMGAAEGMVKGRTSGRMSQGKVCNDQQGGMHE